MTEISLEQVCNNQNCLINTILSQNVELLHTVKLCTDMQLLQVHNDDTEKRQRSNELQHEENRQ